MQIAIFSLIILMVIMTRAHVHHFFEVKQKMSAQIEFDNAFLKLGENDRSFYREVEKFNREIKMLDESHHVFHECAKMPLTSEGCAPADLVLHKEIAALQEQNRAKFDLWWRSNLERFERSIQKGFSGRYGLNRRPRLPYANRICPACKLAVGVNWISDTFCIELTTNERLIFPMALFHQRGLKTLFEDWNFKVRLNCT